MSNRMPKILTSPTKNAREVVNPEPEGRVMIVALRAPSLAKFGEVDTVPVSENSPNTNTLRLLTKK